MGEPIEVRTKVLGSVVIVVPVLIVLVASCGWNSGANTLDVNGQTRSYRLYVPSGYRAGLSLPLVLALHQFSDTAKGMAWLTGFNPLADQEGFFVAYPQGTSRRWRLEAKEDVDFLLALIDHLCTEYAIDEKRIYATGASAGGMMVQALAARTDRLAAIAPVMGTVPQGLLEGPRPPGRLPVLLMHGTQDPILAFGEATETVEAGPHGVLMSAPANAAWWAQHNGCEGEAEYVALPDKHPDDGTTVKRITYPCDKDREVILYRIEGGGHTWPGHENWYPRFIVGPTSEEIDATATIWYFFKRHARQLVPAAS